MRISSDRRNGYALILVLIFVLLFLSILGVAYRQIASVLRVETVRAQQARRDEGSLQAVALGMTLLETGLPPENPYLCCVTLTISTSTGPCSYSYTLTFSSNDSINWSVQAAPTQPGPSPAAMPSVFFPATVP